MFLLLANWDAERLRKQLEQLECDGHGVRTHSLLNRRPTFGSGLDVLIVSLDMLPAHGRMMAKWWLEACAKPLVFVDGSPSAVETTKVMFPDATFAPWYEIDAVLCTLRELVTAEQS